jgi:hypothetical protein
MGRLELLAALAALELVVPDIVIPHTERSLQVPMPGQGPLVTGRHTAATSIDRLVRDLSDNLFVSEEDKKSVAQYVSIVRKEIAWARVDMRKLRYGDE